MIVDKIPAISNLFVGSDLLRVLSKVTDYTIIAVGALLATVLVMSLILLALKQIKK